MKIIKPFFFLLLLSYNALATATDLEQLLKLSPGDQPDQALKAEARFSNFSYQMTKNQTELESLSIHFNKPITSEKILSPETKGFCLIQTPVGHVNLNRYFFFDPQTQRRYELSIQKKIKSILIQKIPGAKENKSCTFGDFNTKELPKPDTKKVE